METATFDPGLSTLSHLKLPCNCQLQIQLSVFHSLSWRVKREKLYPPNSIANCEQQ